MELIVDTTVTGQDLSSERTIATFATPTGVSKYEVAVMVRQLPDPPNPHHLVVRVQRGSDTRDRVDNEERITAEGIGEEIHFDLLGFFSDTIVIKLIDTTGNSSEAAIETVVVRTDDDEALEAIQDQTDLISSTNIITLNPVGKGSLSIVKGDSYANAQGRALLFTKPSGANWPSDLASASGPAWAVKLKANANADAPSGATALGPITGTVVNATNIRFELTALVTAALSPGTGIYDFQIQAEKGTDRATLVTGVMSVLDDENTA